MLARSAGGRNPGWSEDNYWLAIFGEPTDAAPWGWQFGGHHLAVNITVVDGRSYLSPTLIATEPASYDSGGAIITPLAPHLQAGLTLINTLDADTQSAAKVSKRPDELQAGAGKAGTVPPIAGSPVSGWPPAHRALLTDAIAQWVNLLPESDAKLRMAEIAADLDRSHFAWHGEADGSGSIYFRVQAPTLIIEFSTQGDLGSEGGHYHTIYRDPTNEYGSARLH